MKRLAGKAPALYIVASGLPKEASSSSSGLHRREWGIQRADGEGGARLRAVLPQRHLP